MPTDIAPTALIREMNSWRSCAKPWAPHPYQERGIKLMITESWCGLLADPGTGKTSTALAASKILLKKKFVSRVLIVTPLKPLYEVWPKEMCKWKDFHDLGLAVLHGSGKEKALRNLKAEHNIVLINPEGFQWLCASKERVKLLGADMLVIDESSKWKNTQSVRFKALRPILGMFKRRYILTGSPRPKNYLDLFGQIYILDRGDALGQYISHYRSRFFFPSGYMGYDWQLIPGKEEEINALVAPMVLRIDAADWLKLPGTPERDHLVTMPAKTKAIYDQVEDQLLSTLFTQPLTSSAAARAKCAQMANGAVYVDNPEENAQRERPFKEVHTAKVEDLADLYEELQGEPLLISIGYHHDVVAIRSAVDKSIPCINGRATRSYTSNAIDKWNKGKLSALMVHPASAGHGLNLQECGCRHVAFFDIPDDYDLYDQTFRRVWRQGNNAAYVMRHRFITRGTVDEAKIRNLERKGNGQRAFLDAMKWYAEHRRKVKR
jgi:hypothetical protein